MGLRTDHGGLRGWWRLRRTNRLAARGGLDGVLNPPLAGVQRFVFVCSGNQYRSPFAEAVARRCGLPAVSFGIAAPLGQPVRSRAVEAAAARGVDLKAHRTTGWVDFMLQPGDLLLVMEIDHWMLLTDKAFPRGSVTLLGQYCNPPWLHLADPHGTHPDYLSRCYERIEEAVNRLAAEWVAARV